MHRLLLIVAILPSSLLNAETEDCSASQPKSSLEATIHRLHNQEEVQREEAHGFIESLIENEQEEELFEMITKEGPCPERAPILKWINLYASEESNLQAPFQVKVYNEEWSQTLAKAFIYEMEEKKAIVSLFRDFLYGHNNRTKFRNQTFSTLLNRILTQPEDAQEYQWAMEDEYRHRQIILSSQDPNDVHRYFREVSYRLMLEDPEFWREHFPPVIGKLYTNMRNDSWKHPAYHEISFQMGRVLPAIETNHSLPILRWRLSQTNNRASYWAEEMYTGLQSNENSLKRLHQYIFEHEIPTAFVMETLKLAPSPSEKLALALKRRSPSDTLLFWLQENWQHWNGSERESIYSKLTHEWSENGQAILDFLANLYERNSSYLENHRTRALSSVALTQDLEDLRETLELDELKEIFAAWEKMDKLPDPTLERLIDFLPASPSEAQLAAKALWILYKQREELTKAQWKALKKQCLGEHGVYNTHLGDPTDPPLYRLLRAMKSKHPEWEETLAQPLEELYKVLQADP